VEADEEEAWRRERYRYFQEKVGKVRADDPNIGGIRVAQYAATIVRLVLELKQPMRPQVFALAPVAAYRHRLVAALPALSSLDGDTLTELDNEIAVGFLEEGSPADAQPGAYPEHGDAQHGAIGSGKARRGAAVSAHGGAVGAVHGHTAIARWGEGDGA
jgi:hypothetical protein